MSKINISIGSNTGTISAGDHNQFTLSYTAAVERHNTLLSQFDPLFAELARLQPADQQRLRAALESLSRECRPTR